MSVSCLALFEAHVYPSAITIQRQAMESQSAHRFLLNAGQRGVWTSPVSLRASDFFRAFVATLPANHRLPFLCELTRVSLSAVVSRPGLLTLAACLAAASAPPLAVPNPSSSTPPPRNPLSVPAGASPVAEQLQTEEALDRLRAVVNESRRFHNPGYRQAVCEKALGAAAAVAKPPGFTISALAKLVAAFPDGLLAPNGTDALRDCWLFWFRSFVLAGLSSFVLFWVRPFTADSNPFFGTGFRSLERVLLWRLGSRVRAVITTEAIELFCVPRTCLSSIMPEARTLLVASFSRIFLFRGNVLFILGLVRTDLTDCAL